MTVSVFKKLGIGLMLLLGLFSVGFAQNRLLETSTELEPDWYEADWLGIFYAGEYPWIYSVDLDWALVEESGETDYLFYLVTPETWAYIIPSDYPWMFFESLQRWVYYTGQIEPTVVTVAFYLQNDEGEFVPLIDDYTQSQGKIAFNMSDDVFCWSRLADADMQNPEDGHRHYNAAAEMFYQDGVFSWVEYGPKHSEAEIQALVEEGTEGTRKAVTEGTDKARFYYDHNGLFLQIESVE